MNSYRFSAPASISFSVQAETEDDARRIAQEHAESFYDGIGIDDEADTAVFTGDAVEINLDCVETLTTVCGQQIQHDNSGVGHNWRNIDRDEIPADIIEEIEGEIIDGEQESCSDFRASNGEHYRW